MDMEHTDLLLDILRRLAPRSLAVSRCVCKVWRGTIDRHRLLRVHLLPLSLDGAIYDELQMDPPELFGRRSPTRYVVTTNLDYLADDPDYADYVRDYCNGLLLIQSEKDIAKLKVVNPATRQWAALPTLPCACSWPAGSCRRCRNNRYLVYDPTVSPHHEVFFIPRVPADVPADTEWPPSLYVMHVFSSKTNCWEDKSFVRQGDAAGTIQDVISCYDSDRGMYNAAYWQGSLYVPSRHIKHDFLLSIYLVKIGTMDHGFQSRDQIELLKNDANLNLVDEYNEDVVEDGFDWDSDDKKWC
ncbi:hypothetical protein CFC21_004332 [Triticum aestivum]|uniref:F-box domain-containing protein n=1 Tax=Triticum aestivum TaxID=4565 RepID=A0A3B5Y870_WHEAT|nr:hypothetical protein CFC21_004332 [Triticum aestivum]